MGPDCQLLEEQIANLCQTRHAIGCASGSDALLLALMALDVGPGDEVIVPSFTFFATASAVWRLGAKPVFADIDPDTYNLDPEAVARAITPATVALLPVHLFGRPAEMSRLCDLAREHDLRIVEDAAQAVGAAWSGKPVGAWGDIGCLSFYPTKNLGGFGDGGMLVTSDGDLAERLRRLRTHGMKPRYHHQEVGINSRLDTLQAAVLNVKLPHLGQWTELRQAHARRYHELFAAAQLDQQITLPQAANDGGPAITHVWNQFTIRVPAPCRDALRTHLHGAGIGTEIYYPIPLHQQACFAGLGYGKGSLPETERAAKEVLSLPVFPHLTDAEQCTVVDQIAKFFAESARLDDTAAA